MKLKKLDGRHAGYGVWKYYVQQPHGRAGKNRFIEWREWCWSQFGPSKELWEYSVDDLDVSESSSQKWCWVNDRGGWARIYLKTDEAASAFTLQWL